MRSADFDVYAADSWDLAEMGLLKLYIRDPLKRRRSCSFPIDAPFGLTSSMCLKINDFVIYQNVIFMFSLFFTSFSSIPVYIVICKMRIHPFFDFHGGWDGTPMVSGSFLGGLNCAVLSNLAEMVLLVTHTDTYGLPEVPSPWDRA